MTIAELFFMQSYPNDLSYKKISKKEQKLIIEYFNQLEKVINNKILFESVDDLNKLLLEEAEDKSFMQKVIEGFKSSLKEFGEALVYFVKNIVSKEDLKIVFKMLKSFKFLSLAKHLGNWLIKVLKEGYKVYLKAHEILQEAIFKSLANTKPVEWIRDFLQQHLQQQIDDLFNNNEELKRYVEQKYPGRGIKEVLTKPDVLKIVFENDGILNGIKKYGIVIGIGSFLAYLAWNIWCTMIFKGELIYDYDFSAALNAVKGNYNIGEFFFDESGIETLFWLLAGIAGVKSVTSFSEMTNIVIMAVVTIYRKLEGKFEEFKDTKTYKFIVEKYKAIGREFFDVYNEIDDIEKGVELTKKHNILKPINV